MTKAGCHVNQAPRCPTPLCHYHAAKGLTITLLSFTNTNTTLVQLCLTESFDEIWCISVDEITFFFFLIFRKEVEREAGRT